jgi:hypothetical protein
MHEELLDFSAVRLIGGRSHVELHGANDPAIEASEKYKPGSGANGRQYLIAPEGHGISVREGKNKADARARVDAGVEDVAEHFEIGVDGLRRGAPAFDVDRS